MSLKEKVMDLSNDLSQLEANNMMKVAMHFAKTNEVHWKEVLSDLAPESSEYHKAAANWQRVRFLQKCIHEAMEFRGHFLPRETDNE